MAQPEDTIDPDFESQLRGLFAQAERALEHRPGETATESIVEPSPAAKPGTNLSLPQLLRPVVQGLEAVSRINGENTSILKKLDAAAIASADARRDLPQLIADLRALVEMKNGLNQSMFSALHQELKGYKDGFLLESVHRPIIRDLISLYDDIAEITRQVTAALGEGSASGKTPEMMVRMVDRMRALEMNLMHNLEFAAEVLARLEVTVMAPHTGKLDKRTQRAVLVEAADDPEQDGDVVRTVRCGFCWQQRVLRAEEVVIKKWKEGCLMALPPPLPE
jgi:molecular chaperone GrpE (heat shock protein)